MLVACEESQRVCTEFRRLGHEAYSCDLLPCGGGHPEWHIQADALQVCKLAWDLVIAHPPCTALSSSGARWFEEKRRDGRQQMGVGFFLAFTALDHVPRVCIENPVGIMSSLYRKPDQVIHPWMFGHGETKATCLWLKGLPPLEPTHVVEGREQRIWRMPPGPERNRMRSVTYRGVARAMAEQWGGEA